MRRVGPFLFNAATGTLVDDSGAVIALKERSRRLLEFFLSVKDQRLPVAAIARHLWPGDPPNAKPEDRYNDVNVAVAALRRSFGKHGERLLPRALKGEYRLVGDGDSSAGQAASPPRGLESGALLDAQRLGAESPFRFHSRTEVALHGPHTAVLPRPKDVAGNLIAGVTYHFFFGAGDDQIAAAARVAAALYRETSAESPDGRSAAWRALIRNLRLCFLQRPAAPFDLTIVNAQDYDQMVVYLRQPGEPLHERYGAACASAYWRSLDPAPDLHRWRPLWTERPAELDKLLATFESFAARDPEFPEPAWRVLIDLSRARPIAAARRHSKKKHRSG